LAPPPSPSPVSRLSVASTSTNNIEHGAINASQEQNKKKKKKKKIEDLGDQGVPQGKRSNKRPVIVHNGLDEYYRSRVDAPVIRYNNTNTDNNNNNSNNAGNDDRQTSQANSDGSQNDPIFVE
jgi:molecular chaperone DnaK (HSP70)